MEEKKILARRLASRSHRRSTTKTGCFARKQLSRWSSDRQRVTPGAPQLAIAVCRGTLPSRHRAVTILRAQVRRRERRARKYPPDYFQSGNEGRSSEFLIKNEPDRVPEITTENRPEWGEINRAAGGQARRKRVFFDPFPEWG